MAMGKRKSEQASMWVSSTDLPVSPGHPFYTRLNTILVDAGFDRFAEDQCSALPLGRALELGENLALGGYFEGWRILWEEPELKRGRYLARTIVLLSLVALALGTWPMVKSASGQPPGYACPYGYYYATNGYCYPAQQPAYAYYPPPVYEYAPPVYQPPAVYDGYGIGLGFGLLFGEAEGGRGRGDRGRGERERGHR